MNVIHNIKMNTDNYTPATEVIMSVRNVALGRTAAEKIKSAGN
jgi:hypothetical protein